MATAFLALGSNLGDARANLAAAVAALTAEPGITVLAVARVIETEPVDCPPGSPPFLNSAAKIETTLSPHDLLHCLKAIERRFGRSAGVRNAPRPIDLDILLFDEQTMQTPDLTIPHLRMHQRRFVLEPLAQIAPDARHPILNKSVAELLADLSE